MLEKYSSESHEHVGVYVRVANAKNHAFEEHFDAVKEYINNDYVKLTNHPLSIHYYLEDECLGSSNPFSRIEFIKMLSDIEEKNIKTIIVRDLCVITTNPQELVICLYNITERGARVVVMDGTVITSQSLKTFNYLGVLAQVENLIANNADGRFKLIGDHPKRKVWYDTLEEVFYCKTWFDDDVIRFHLADYSFYYETDKWHTKEGIDEYALNQLYQIIYESHFVEEVTYNGVNYYVWFEANVWAQYEQCGVGLSKRNIVEIENNK